MCTYTYENHKEYVCAYIYTLRQNKANKIRRPKNHKRAKL